MTLAEAVGWGAGSLAWLHATMAAVAVVLTAWDRWRGQVRGAAQPPLTILRPLEGVHPGLDADLASFVTAPWPAARQHLVCLPNRADPAAAEAQALAERHPGADISLITSDGGPPWANRKIRHLIAGVEAARHDALVFADGDIRAEEATLPALVAPLADDRVGLVYAPTIVLAEGSAAARVQSAILGRGFHAFSVLAGLSRFTGGVPAMVGGLWATRRGTLARMGGLTVAASHIGDDLALAEAAHRAGLKVRISPEPALSHEPQLTFAQLWGRLVRWIAVLGAHQPHKLAGYPGLIAQLPLVLAAGGMAALLDQGWALTLVGLAGLSRWLMALYLGRIGRLPWRPGLLLWIVAADTLLLAAFLAAAGRRQVQWRGRSYRLAPGGAIEEVR